MPFRPSEDDLIDTIDPMCNATPDRCRWGCGNQCAHTPPNDSANEPFGAILHRFANRRGFLAASATTAAGLLVLKTTGAGAPSTAAAQAASSITFTPIGLDGADQVKAAPGYTSKVLIRWGDKLWLDGPDFEFGKVTKESQLRSFGYNCDYIGYYPRDAKHGYLVVNHEYTNPDIMFPGYSADNPTKEQVDVELAAHGLTIVDIQRYRGSWRYVLNGWHNRRISGFSRTMLDGPAAGHPMLKTSTDPWGQFVDGTLNNCAAGQTPWGTVLTCEENFNQYFANNDNVADAKTKAAHTRYGLPAKASERKWERFYDRFDLGKEPNEAFKFGWVVEIDPEDPAGIPMKHTALGRFKHEATSTVIAPDGRAVVYMGDDERFDYVYKFVSAGKYDATDRSANKRLLASGTLYVAKFNDDGTGAWLPLVFGQGKLTAANGFTDQGDVVIRARAAGDAVGATKMDRPEDIEVNPKNGKVYCVMTNNTRRGTGTNAGIDKANPRAENKHGHIIELESVGDHASTSFRWGMFMLCGDPAVDSNTYFAGFDPKKVSPLSSPDNITFDREGNLWIATDGQIGTFKKNDGVYAVPVEGPERGYVRQFFSGVPGGETASLCFDDRDETLFVTIQHPGEGSALDNLSSKFPDAKEPRPSVVFVMKDGGGRIGS
ncbi:MAG: PhoX family protein [Dehalococcoidia bacterium]